MPASPGVPQSTGVPQATAGSPQATAPGVPRPAGLPRAAELTTMSMAVRPASADDDLITIGVSIEVPEPYGHQLQDWRREFGDPQAEAIPTHVTLLPPTEVSPAVATAIREHLAQVASRTTPFDIRLRGTGSFRPISPVVFVVLAEGAQGCIDLQRAIRSGPLERDLPFPFHPHVTVAHHLSEPELDRAQATLLGYTAEFTVSSLGLYEHGQDGVWRLRRRFRFGDAD